MDQYKLVFSGDILPGHDTDEVKARLIQLLGLTPDKVGHLFSGKPVVIKKGLDADKAQAYRRKLAAKGIGIRVESHGAAVPDSAPATQPASTLMLEPLTVPAPTQTPPDHPPGPAPAPIDEMHCPECGHAQPKRTLCINCGLDMPRFLAARAEQEQEAREPDTAAAAASIRTYERAPMYTAHGERPAYFGLSFEGRLSRRSYFTGGCLLMLAFLAILFATSAMGFPKLAIPVAIASVVLAVRLGVLRAHDFNWSGWWMLLSAVPGVNAVFSLLLSFFPGSADDNDYGEKPEPTPWSHAFGALALAVLFPVAIAVMAPSHLAKGLGQFSGQPGPFAGPMSAAPSMNLDGYDPALNDLVMYSLAGCGHCALKRAQFDTLGVRYIEVFIDSDAGANQALQTKLQAIGYQGQGVETPIIEINGTLLVNNPSLDEISKYFYRRRS